MYPTPDKKEQENEIDEDQVYCTNASIRTVGRGVAVDLNDAMLPGDEKNKHMTILFRKGGKWSDKELALISSESAAWITTRFGPNAPVTFTIAHWGADSVKVKGDLEALCLHLRSKFAAMSGEKQRDPHIALFKGKRGGDRKGRGKDKKEKTCRICDQPGHFKKDCPSKENKKERKDKKKDSKKKHDHHQKEDKKVNQVDKQEAKAQKVQEKLQKIIVKTQQMKQFKQQEVQLLDEQEAQLVGLLAHSDQLDAKSREQ